MKGLLIFCLVALIGIVVLSTAAVRTGSSEVSQEFGMDEVRDVVRRNRINAGTSAISLWHQTKVSTLLDSFERSLNADPETGKPYAYTEDAGGSWKLCATLSTGQRYCGTQETVEDMAYELDSGLIEIQGLLALYLVKHKTYPAALTDLDEVFTFMDEELDAAVAFSSFSELLRAPLTYQVFENGSWYELCHADSYCVHPTDPTE